MARYALVHPQSSRKTSSSLLQMGNLPSRYLWNGQRDKSLWDPCELCCLWFYKILNSPMPPIFFEPKTMMWIFPSPGEDNPIHLIIFLHIFPWLARGCTPGGSRWHVHYGRWPFSRIKPQVVFYKVRFLTHLHVLFWASSHEPTM